MQKTDGHSRGPPVADTRRLCTPRPSTSSPPNDSLLTIVIPSYSPHLAQVVQQLGDWRRFCGDLHRVLFDIVVTREDVGAFRSTLAATQPRDMLCNTRLAVLDSLLEDTSLRTSLRRLVLADSYHLIQSVKKLLGCAQADTEWCFAVDSELRLLRPLSVADVLAGYARRKAVLFNGQWLRGRQLRPGSKWLCVTANDDALLRGRVRRDQWFMDSYAWFWERRIVRAFNAVALPRLGAMRPHCNRSLMVESTLYQYIRASERWAGGYTFVDISKRWSELGLPPYLPPDSQYPGCSSGECVGVLLMGRNRFNMTNRHTDAIAALLKAHAIPTYSPRGRRFHRETWARFFNRSGVAFLTSPDYGHDLEQVRGILEHTDAIYGHGFSSRVETWNHARFKPKI